MKMKIYRSIRANELSDINIADLGLHWSECAQAAENVANCGYGGGEGEIFTLVCEVSKDTINFNASIDSRLNYPGEYEIVLYQNEELTVEIRNESWEKVYEGKANSGTRCDAWVAGATQWDSYSEEEFRIKLIEVELL